MVHGVNRLLVWVTIRSYTMLYLFIEVVIISVFYQFLDVISLGE